MLRTDRYYIFKAAKAKMKMSYTKFVTRPIIPRDEPPTQTRNAFRPRVTKDRM